MLKIRLTRMGAKKKPFYRVIIKEQRSKRDGKYLENLGTYNPMVDPPEVKLNHERIQYWIGQGAQPTETVASLIKHNPQLTEEEQIAFDQKRAEAKAEKIAAVAKARDEKANAIREEAEKEAAEKAAAAKVEAEAAKVAAAEAKEAEAKAAEAPEEPKAEDDATAETAESAGDVAVEEAPADEVKAEAAPAEEAKAEAAPAEEAKADEAKAETAPAEEAKVEEAPAAEADVKEESETAEATDGEEPKAAAE